MDIALPAQIAHKTCQKFYAEDNNSKYVKYDWQIYHFSAYQSTTEMSLNPTTAQKNMKRYIFASQEIQIPSPFSQYYLSAETSSKLSLSQLEETIFWTQSVQTLILFTSFRDVLIHWMQTRTSLTRTRTSWRCPTARAPRGRPRGCVSTTTTWWPTPARSPALRSRPSGEKFMI